MGTIAQNCYEWPWQNWQEDVCKNNFHNILTHKHHPETSSKELLADNEEASLINEP